MRVILSFICVLFLMCFRCDGPGSGGDCGEPGCKKATVKALNLDGCQFALDLIDGTRLIPEMRVYVQAPNPEEDPAYYFEFVDGMEVCIKYNESTAPNICMAGQTVFLTFIETYSSN